MIFPDANLLLYAEDSLSKHHEAARDWWDTALGGSDAIHLSAIVNMVSPGQHRTSNIEHRTSNIEPRTKNQEPRLPSRAGNLCVQEVFAIMRIAVHLCWPVVNAFVRIATNPRLHERPLTPDEAILRVESWLNQPCVRMISPTENHWTLFQAQLRESGASGNLVSDAHLAALAIEHGCILYSSDQDFARFPSLRWINPLS